MDNLCSILLVVVAVLAVDLNVSVYELMFLCNDAPEELCVIYEELGQVGVPEGSDENHFLTQVGV